MPGINLLDVILHLDKYLQIAIDNYGLLVYALLFAVIFVETGIVFMAFLPGDSLIFAAGAFAAAGSFDLYILFVLFFAAVGDIYRPAARDGA